MFPSVDALNSKQYNSLKVTTRKLRDPTNAYLTEQLEELAILNPGVIPGIKQSKKPREILPLPQ